MMATDYQRANRRSWNQLSREGSYASVPWEDDALERPRAWLDEHDWIPWNEIGSVLVLGGGGGQQAPLFAHAGYRTTVVDLSPEQLLRDKEVSEQLGVELECLEGDMCDLSMLRGRAFDLVYQPPSTCYVPEVRSCYREVASVLSSRGVYFAQHWSPVQMQVADHAWDGSAYRLDWPVSDHRPRKRQALEGSSAACWHYVHSFHDLLGGLCETGFTIEEFAEQGPADLRQSAGSAAHVGAFFPTFLVVLARMREAREGS